MYEYLDRRYALALYKVGEEKGKAEAYLEQLREVVDLIYGNEEMMKFLKHPEISISRKKETLKSIFQDKLDIEVLTFLLILVDKNRILYLKEKLKEMEKIHLEKNNTVIAIVKTVIPMLDSEKSQLVVKLEKKYNKKVLLNEEIDPSLLGGVYVRVGDDIIDGSIKLKLQEMRKLMLKSEQR